jgi:hypothetical protein
VENTLPENHSKLLGRDTSSSTVFISDCRKLSFPALPAQLLTDPADIMAGCARAGQLPGNLCRPLFSGTGYDQTKAVKQASRPVSVIGYLFRSP